MSLPQEVRAAYNAAVNSGNITYATGLTDTPASGAPGAFKKMLADATATATWWFCSLIFGNLSGAGATAFNFGVNRVEDGTGSNIHTFRILLEAATAALQGTRTLPYPVATPAGSGAAANQTTASGKTLDVTIEYGLLVGS
ncbi:MAG: hypothetical protein C4534_08285 [Gaiellales bacterium]|nr:MAG: hypothetical protein C4534_08285 [Gaiellales bacterium]